MCGARAMSALPPKADISEGNQHVRFVPKADKLILFYHFVGAAEYAHRERETKCLRDFKIDD